MSVCQSVHRGKGLIWPLQTCSNLETLRTCSTPPPPHTQPALGLPPSTLLVKVMFYYLVLSKWDLLANCIWNVWTNKWPLSIDYGAIQPFDRLDPNLMNGNSVTVLMPNYHSAIQTHLKRIRNLRYFENTRLYICIDLCNTGKFQCAENTSYCGLVVVEWTETKTRMHSSRMRTSHLLPVSPSMHCSRGGYLPRGVPVRGRGVPAQVLPPPHGRQTRVKT